MSLEITTENHHLFSIKFFHEIIEDIWVYNNDNDLKEQRVIQLGLEIYIKSDI
jgi:hypothetical protein